MEHHLISLTAMLSHCLSNRIYDKPYYVRRPGKSFWKNWESFMPLNSEGVGSIQKLHYHFHSDTVNSRLIWLQLAQLPAPGCHLNQEQSRREEGGLWLMGKLRSTTPIRAFPLSPVQGPFWRQTSPCYHHAPSMPHTDTRQTPHVKVGQGWCWGGNWVRSTSSMQHVLAAELAAKFSWFNFSS